MSAFGRCSNTRVWWYCTCACPCPPCRDPRENVARRLVWRINSHVDRVRVRPLSFCPQTNPW